MTESGCYTVLSIDDHPLFRKGVEDLIEMGDGLKLVGEAANGQDGIRLAQDLNPDLILLDINMKGMNGIDTLKALRKLELDSRILMLTVSDHEGDVIAALRLGADGYLLKDMEPEDMLNSLQMAVGGQIVISEDLTQLLAQALRQEDTAPSSVRGAQLTDREQEILQLLAKGMSNKSIAKVLSISDSTVKVHVKHVLKKLNLHSRVEAAVWALKRVSTS